MIGKYGDGFKLRYKSESESNNLLQNQKTIFPTPTISVDWRF